MALGIAVGLVILGVGVSFLGTVLIITGKYEEESENNTKWN